MIVVIVCLMSNAGNGSLPFQAPLFDFIFHDRSAWKIRAKTPQKKSQKSQGRSTVSTSSSSSTTLALPPVPGASAILLAPPPLFFYSLLAGKSTAQRHLHLDSFRRFQARPVATESQYICSAPRTPHLATIAIGLATRDALAKCILRSSN